MRRVSVAAIVSVVGLLVAAPAAAQPVPLPPPTLERNDYALELFQGPVFAPVRVTGLAGATTAIADAVEGVYSNAGAPAVREAFSHKWFEWEPSFGISLPGAYGGTDFNNRGEKGIERNLRLGRRRTVETTDRFLYVQAGMLAQFGDLGLSATADILNYDVTAPEGSTPSLSMTLTRMHFVAAYSLLGNQLAIGAGVRAVYVSMDQVDVQNGAVIGMLGAAPQVGVVVKPDHVQWRVGATARAAVEAGPLDVGRVVEQELPSGDRVRSAGTFVLPDRITQPWELEAGVAYQIGPRPLNPAWIDPHEHENNLEERVRRSRLERQAAYRAEIARLPDVTEADRVARELRILRIEAEEKEYQHAEDIELREGRQSLYAERRARYMNWPRERVLLLASAVLTGPSHQAVALEGFINRERELVGRTVSFSPRVAVESEPAPNLLRFRAGVYLEPSRFADGTHRQHFTFGSDVRLISWNLFGLINEQTWRLSAFVDLAPRYQSFGLGLGAWH